MVLLCARKKLQKKIDTKDKKRLNTKIISVNNVGFFVSPRFQLDAVSNHSDELPELRPMIDIPIEPSGDDLRTINQDVLSSLCTEQPGADSPVDQAVASCVLDVGEELIGTCVTPTKVRTVQQTLGSENEPHLCALKFLQSFFTTEEHVTHLWQEVSGQHQTQFSQSISFYKISSRQQRAKRETLEVNYK